ncbi:MAG: ABC transporter substrate-binding protein [Anaerovoracaceae bacterium]|jgi:peptide/nickel transport system substrate-binding protein
MRKSNGKIKAIITGALIALTVVSLTACGSSSSSDTTYKTRKEVQLPMYSVKTLNPAISTDEDTYHITRLIYSGLYTLDENLTPQTDLARRSVVNKSSKSITVKMNSAKFQDGHDVTATDVKFSVEAYQQQGEKCRYYYLVEPITSVKVVSDDTVRFYFDKKSQMQFARLTFPILPSNEYDSVDDLLSTKDFKPVGSGQYEYKSYDASNTLKLTPYSEYYGEKAVSDVTFNVMPDRDSDTAINLLESNTISYMVSKSDTRDSDIQKSSVKIIDFPSNQMEMIGFNCKKKHVTRKKNIRKGVAYAVDTSQIITDCYSNCAQKNDNLYFPGYLGVSSRKDAFPYNLNKAVRCFEDAGYADDDNDGTLTDVNGNQLELTILVNKDTSRTEAVSIIQKSLESVGVSVTVESKSQKEYISALKKGNFDLYYGGYSIDEVCDMSPLLSSDGDYNYGGYTNDELDTYLDQLGAGLEGQEAVSKYKQIKGVLSDKVPCYCVCYLTYGAIRAPALRGDVNPVFNNFYNGVGGWTCRYESGSSNSSN